MFHNLGFIANYDCEVLPGLPGVGPVPLQFHPQGQSTHSQGLVIKVVPNSGIPWIGNFQFGDGTLSEVYSTPSEQIVCVVAKGQGYLVPVNRPVEYQIVKSYPIKEVFPVPQRRLVVFADFTKLSAYGADFVWVTSRLSWDGLKITSVTSELIQGLAWDSPLDKEVEFFVDVRTGRHTGGSSPDRYTANKQNG